jgi:hypothetical protein
MVRLLRAHPESYPFASSAHHGGVTEAASPIACSLTSQEIETRGAEWSALMRHAATVVANDGGARATFASDPAMAARVADLAVREQECCPFFRFTIEIVAGGLTLDVAAPAEAGALARQLLGIG